MRIEMLVIGNELLDGRVTDSNSVYFGKGLNELGFELAQRTTIPDDLEQIVATCRRIIERGTTVCVVSGGLGPTSDDCTAQAFADLAGVELIREEKAAAKISQYLSMRNRPISENQLKQADRPMASKMLDNPIGTAPAFEILVDGCRFIALPGVPEEYRALLGRDVLQPLSESFGEIHKEILRTFGLYEVQVENLLAGIGRWPEVTLGYRAHFPEIEISLRAPKEFRGQLNEAAVFASEALGKYVFSRKREPFGAGLVEALRKRGQTLALAESCSGGRMAGLITEVDGAGSVFLGGMIAYANEFKLSKLGVQPTTLENHGVVSEMCVSEMAAGIRREFGSDYGIAISGIAGPSGGTADKPVGTIWLALVTPTGATTRKLSISYDRKRNQALSAHAGLDLLRLWLMNNPA